MAERKEGECQVAAGTGSFKCLDSQCESPSFTLRGKLLIARKLAFAHLECKRVFAPRKNTAFQTGAVHGRARTRGFKWF